MRTWRRLLMAVIVVTAAALQTGDAAAVAWCSDDPQINITTPAGNHVVVYLTNYGEGLEHLAQLQALQTTVSVADSDGDRQTAVQLTVFIPDAGGARFRTFHVVSTSPDASGVTLASRVGTSGETQDLRFTVDVP